MRQDYNVVGGLGSVGEVLERGHISLLIRKRFETELKKRDVATSIALQGEFVIVVQDGHPNNLQGSVGQQRRK